MEHSAEFISEIDLIGKRPPPTAPDYNSTASARPAC